MTLSCIAGLSPRVRSIDIVYIGSIWDDINREKPFSARVTDPNAIKLAHTLTEPPFMEYYLQQMGLHQLMNRLDLDFVIGNTLAYGGDYFPISRSMGYAIKNFGGIRFAMICTPKDSLTMEDQVTLSLLKERSDILWVIDEPLLRMSPSLIKLNIDQRSLSDTTISAIKAKEDTIKARLINDFRRRIESDLSAAIQTGGPVAEHVFSTVAQKENVNVIIYPEELIIGNERTDVTNLRNLMRNIRFDMKFKKAEMERAEISEFCETTGCLTWGEIKQTNNALVPDQNARHNMFDYYHGRIDNED